MPLVVDLAAMRSAVKKLGGDPKIIGRAIDELRWPAPVRPGDTLRVEIEILEARLSQSKPGHGLIRYRSLTKTRGDEVVQSFIALAILPASQPAIKNQQSGTKLGGEGIEPPTNTV